MEATFPAEKLRTFNHALTCLSKVGDVLNFQVSREPAASRGNGLASSATPAGSPIETSLRLSTINSSSSAFCAFVFAEAFFDYIKLRTSHRHLSAGSNRLECQINIRSLVASLKISGNRKLEQCRFHIVDHGQECRFAVQLHYQFGVNKTHRLTYEAQKALYPSANPDEGSLIVVSAAEVQEWLLHFAVTGRGADISFWCGTDFCSIRSKSDDFEAGNVRKSIQTEVKVETTQFDVYHVVDEVYLSLPLKEFRAAVGFAESVSSRLELRFSHGGEPLFVKVLADDIIAETVIATTDSKPVDAAARPSAMVRSKPQTAEPLKEMPDIVKDDGNAASETTAHSSTRLPLVTSESTQLNGQQPEDGADRHPINRVERAIPTFASRHPVQESQEPSSIMPLPLRPSQIPQESTPQPRSDVSPKEYASPQGQEDNMSTGLFRGGPSASQDQPPPTTSRAYPNVFRAMAPPTVQRRTLPQEKQTTSHAGEDDSFDDDMGEVIDYGQALDEMESGIESGRIQVHGSQATAVRTSSQANVENPMRTGMILEERLQSPVFPPAEERNTATGDESTTMDESRTQLQLEVMEDSGMAGNIQPEAEADQDIENGEEEEMPQTQVGSRVDENPEADVDEESLPRRKKFRPMNF